MRALLREKLKKLMDFNGQLINKVNTNYHKLGEEEIKFYNNLIHSNLLVLNNVGNSMIVHQTILADDWCSVIICPMKHKLKKKTINQDIFFPHPQLSSFDIDTLAARNLPPTAHQRPHRRLSKSREKSSS
jgi:hypothetical protein